MEDKAQLRFGTIIHFRNPHRWYRDPTELYGEIIDSLVMAEELGYDAVYLTEHHFTADDWAPSPLILLSAIAMRTKKIRLSTNVALLPFYHPVRLAEDGAVLDILSGGRYEFQFGLGYRPEEFGAYGMQMKERSRRADEMLEIIRRLWEGETVTFKGKYFSCENATLTPRPVQRPRPPMIIGGFAPNAIKRAARMADGLAGASPQGLKIYHEELRRLGKDPAKAKIVSGNPWLYVSNDPDKTWNEIAPYVMHAIDCYSEWMKTWNTPPLYPAVANKEELKKTGLLTVLTPDDAVKAVREQIENLHITTYTFVGNEAACPYHIMREHYELFAREVIPRVRQTQAS
jgi:alkanesulfonate monooxygenase SsuD/methylene tetrahydromethanopterin reductase-like flavin-dependent oxidoreductase (luciferase family)